MACLAGTPIKLSASLGGEPISLDTPTVPGQIAHSNPLSAGNNHVIEDLQVTNHNTATVSLYLKVTGLGIPPPSAQEDMRRFDVVPSEEGRSTTILPVPLILAPGYDISISVTLPPGGVPLLLDGLAYEASGSGTDPGTDPGTGDTTRGYGGIQGSDMAAPAVLPDAPDWATMPTEQTATTQYKNTTLNPANGQISMDIAGVWQLAIGATITHDESTSGRTFLARLYNVTQGAAIGEGVPFGIGRNNSVSSLQYVTQIQIEDGAGVGDLIEVQLQSEGTDIPVVLWDSTEFSVVLLDTVAVAVDEGDLVDHTVDGMVDHTGDQLQYVG